MLALLEGLYSMPMPLAGYRFLLLLLLLLLIHVFCVTATIWHRWLQEKMWSSSWIGAGFNDLSTQRELFEVGSLKTFALQDKTRGGREYLMTRTGQNGAGREESLTSTQEYEKWQFEFLVI